jgi:hypothetical protein
MIAIADDRHFTYDNEIELLQFIASEMQKEGLDINNEKNLDSYLNMLLKYRFAERLNRTLLTVHLYNSHLRELSVKLYTMPVLLQL